MKKIIFFTFIIFTCVCTTGCATLLVGIVDVTNDYSQSDSLNSPGLQIPELEIGQHYVIQTLDSQYVAGELSEIVMNSGSGKWYGSTIIDSSGEKIAIPSPGDTLKIIVGPDVVHFAEFIAYENRRIVCRLLERDRPTAIAFNEARIYSFENYQLRQEHFAKVMQRFNAEPVELIIKTIQEKNILSIPFSEIKKITKLTNINVKQNSIAVALIFDAFIIYLLVRNAPGIGGNSLL